MKDADRKNRFFFFKRKTNDPAWRRQAAIFDQFVEIYGLQVREEPISPGVMETNWEMFFPKVLKAQLLYEQALERFLQGDRTVFYRNALDDATELANFWYTELVNHGMREDHFWSGKYEQKLTALMRLFFDASEQRS